MVGAGNGWALRFRDRVAVKIAALVLMVLLANVGSVFVMLQHLRALQGSFDLLTAVYVVFNQRLASAHVQAVRVGVQVGAVGEQERLAPQAPTRLDTAFLRNFEEGLHSRNRLIREALAPLDDALLHPERFGGGSERLHDLRELRESLDELEGWLAQDELSDPVEVLRDRRAQSRIERSFQTLAAQSNRAIVELQSEVRDLRARTERVTWALTALTTLLGIAAAIGVFLTLRPLRRLTSSVRKLGGGDWTQRIPTAKGGREDEVSRLGQEFNHMADALEERERRLLQGERLAAAGRLAAQITHEIRNPLSSVALNVELLEDELDEATPEARQLLARITSEVDRLTAVTEDYLSFARRSKPQFTAVELVGELRHLLEFLAGEHARAGIEVEPQWSVGTAWVHGDAQQLRGAFMNLLRNAKEALLDDRAAPQGARRIALAVELVESRVEVRVEDNGPGIPSGEGNVDRIFEAFFTSKAHGTGLGLPIVQQVLHDHGGTIHVAHTGGHGTVFIVRIPACDPPTSPVSSEPAKGR